MKLRRNAAMLCILLVVLSTLNVGCGKNVTPHPNQLSALDGQAYDRLTEAKAALDDAKAKFLNHELDAIPHIKDVINGLGATYDTTRASWFYYRDVANGVKTGDQNQATAKLQADMVELVAAIARLTAAVGGK